MDSALDGRTREQRPPDRAQNSGTDGPLLSPTRREAARGAAGHHAERRRLPPKNARHNRWSEASVRRAGAGQRRRRPCSTEGRAKAASSVQAEAASGGCSVAGEVPLVNSVIEFVKLEKKNRSAMAAACITCERAPWIHTGAFL
ncbi:unnamed protein product [Urochloa humidicola]